jgi:glycosidase
MFTRNVQRDTTRDEDFQVTAILENLRDIHSRLINDVLKVIEDEQQLPIFYSGDELGQPGRGGQFEKFQGTRSGCSEKLSVFHLCQVDEPYAIGKIRQQVRAALDA